MCCFYKTDSRSEEPNEQSRPLPFGKAAPPPPQQCFPAARVASALARTVPGLLGAGCGVPGKRASCLGPCSLSH